MSKITVKFELNGKNICTKKLIPTDTLESIRQQQKEKIGDSIFLDAEGSPIDKSDEKEFKLSEVLNGNILKLKNDNVVSNEGITIFLNGKQFCMINISPEESLEKLRNVLSSKIKEDFSFLDDDGNPIEKNEEKDFSIKEELKEGIIKIKSNTISITPIQTINKEETSSEKINEQHQNNQNKVNYDLSNYDVLEKKDGLTYYLYSKQQAQKPHKLVVQYFFDKYGPNDYKDAKIILFVGKTGDGKTTAINSFFNIIKGITLYDNYRFILIKEPKKQKEQAESQTDGVHLYYLKDKDNKPIIIIDSQGFGDTRGKTYDEMIIDAFTHIFTEVIDHINAVSFIVKATDCRLDIQIKYIINKVTGLFSEDISVNFFVLATHAGKEAIEGPPNMIKTLQTNEEFLEIKKKMPNKWYYAVDSKSVMENEKDKLTLFSYAQLNELYKEKIIISRPISVKKCSEVLKGRNELNIQVNNLSSKFKNMLSEQNNLKIQEKSIESVNKQIEDLQNQIEAEKAKFKNLKGKDLEKAMLELNEQVNKRIYELGHREESQQVRTLKIGCSGEEYSHCETCKENCHDPCDCFHFFTSRCTIYPVFGSDCEKCGHPKSEHSRDKYRYTYEYIKIKAIDSDEINKTKLEKERKEQELKENIREENAKKTNIEKMIDNLQKNVEKLKSDKEKNVKKKEEIEKKIKETNKSILIIIIRLQSISQRISDLAMNNNYIQRDNEYIDSLIDKYTEVYGSNSENVKELEAMKKQNEKFQKATSLKKEEIFNMDENQISELLKKMNLD